MQGTMRWNSSEWVRTSNQVIRSPVHYRWTTAPATTEGGLINWCWSYPLAKIYWYIYIYTSIWKPGFNRSIPLANILKESSHTVTETPGQNHRVYIYSIYMYLVGYTRSILKFWDDAFNHRFSNSNQMWWRWD